MTFISTLNLLFLSSTCVVSESFSGHNTFNFSNRNLTSVPQTITSFVTDLILSHNLLAEIKYGDFNRMINLTYLDISNNRINLLNKMSFKGLRHLKILNISSNRLGDDGSLPGGLFQQMSSTLLELDIRHNLIYKSYPEEAIKDLISLRTLKLDCVNDILLGEAFSQLHNLSELLFAKGKFPCRILPKNMFQSIENSSIKYLDLSGVGYFNVLDLGKWKLKYLETLKLSHNKFFDNGMPSIFTGHIGMPNLMHLYLHNVSMNSNEFNRLVQNMNGSKLKTLELDQNVITDRYLEIHPKLPELEKISLAGNQLLSTLELLADILSLRHLKYVNLRGQNRIWSYQSFHRYRRFVSSEYPPTRTCITSPHRTCPFELPENLTHMDLSSWAFKLSTIPQLALMNNNTLQFVNLSSNAIQQLPKPFYCAGNSKPAFRILDLSNNKIKCINSSYFTFCNWSSLNILKLNNNQLRQRNFGDCNSNGTEPLGFIKPLLNLTRLDLSGNELDWEMNPKTFENQTNLEELFLSNMRMHDFIVEIEHMTKLRYLDISSNNIKCLNENTTMELKNLKSNSTETLQVNLQNNPLQCSCDCYSFFKWYKFTKITFVGKNHLYCILGEKKYYLSNISEILMILNASCYPRTWSNFLIGGQFAIYFVIILFSLYKRHKYRIYFFYLKCRILLLSRMVAEDVKQFNAFISYASPDRQWVKKRLIKNLEKRRKLKLFVASRDFEPGKLITVNIHDAITTSAKTVFVISRSFLESSWCLEEFSMALTESRKRRKFIIICILSPNITLEDIKYPDMKEVLQNVTYLRWPPRRTGEKSSELSNRREFKHFWQKLYTNIVTRDRKNYPNISVMGHNRNIPV